MYVNYYSNKTKELLFGEATGITPTIGTTKIWEDRPIKIVRIYNLCLILKVYKPTPLLLEWGRGCFTKPRQIGIKNEFNHVKDFKDLLERLLDRGSKMGSGKRRNPY